MGGWSWFLATWLDDNPSKNPSKISPGIVSAADLRAFLEKLDAKGPTERGEAGRDFINRWNLTY